MLLANPGGRRARRRDRAAARRSKTCFPGEAMGGVRARPRAARARRGLRGARAAGGGALARRHGAAAARRRRRADGRHRGRVRPRALQPARGVGRDGADHRPRDQESVDSHPPLGRTSARGLEARVARLRPRAGGVRAERAAADRGPCEHSAAEFSDYARLPAAARWGRPTSASSCARRRPRTRARPGSGWRSTRRRARSRPGDARLLARVLVEPHRQLGRGARAGGGVIRLVGRRARREDRGHGRGRRSRRGAGDPSAPLRSLLLGQERRHGARPRDREEDRRGARRLDRARRTVRRGASGSGSTCRRPRRRGRLHDGAGASRPPARPPSRAPRLPQGARSGRAVPTARASPRAT